MARSSEIYRESSIGRCLQDTLNDLVLAGRITPLQAVQVVMQFDKSMSKTFARKVKLMKFYADIRVCLFDISPEIQTATNIIDNSSNVNTESGCFCNFCSQQAVGVDDVDLLAKENESLKFRVVFATTSTFDDVWKFDLDNALIRITHQSLPSRLSGKDPRLGMDVTLMDRLKVVAIDAKMFLGADSEPKEFS